MRLMTNGRHGLSGAASLVTSTFRVGIYLITAAYRGEGAFQSAVSNTVQQALAAILAAMTLMTSANPLTSGQPVTFTATVTGSLGPIPTGTVSFYSGSVLNRTRHFECVGSRNDYDLFSPSWSSDYHRDVQQRSFT